ncbi:MAG: secondary thiamine-phosphate synthase enzyme YjbQ [Bacillota bacterium]
MKKLSIKTDGLTSIVDITVRIREYLRVNKFEDGILTIFVPHTTAGIVINENADSTVKDDIEYKLKDLIPVNDNYKHLEGNSHAHIKSCLFGSSETVIVENNKLVLGRWQGIYLCDFDGPRQRDVYLKFIKS